MFPQKHVPQSGKADYLQTIGKLTGEMLEETICETRKFFLKRKKEKSLGLYEDLWEEPQGEKSSRLMLPSPACSQS